MGLMELKEQAYKVIKPDALKLSVKIDVYKFNVKDTETSFKDAYEEIKRAVAELTDAILDIDTESINVSNTTITYSKKENVLQDKSLLKSTKKTYDITASVFIDISVNIINFDMLTKIATILLNYEDKNIYINHITYDGIYNTMKEEEEKLKEEVCSNCRKSADTIAKSLGSSITGINKVVYNSEGKLLASPATVSVQNHYDVEEINDDMGTDFDLFEEASDKSFSKNAISFSASKSSKEVTESPEERRERLEKERKERHEKFAKGFVHNIITLKHTISDSVTVVFELK